jgi:hypothetical protein
MSPAGDLLEKRFTELLGWERRKWHEQILISVVCTALALALLVMPFHGYLPMRELRWFVPLVFLLGIAPWSFYRWRFRQQDATRALVRLDKTLNSAERATTAWEFSRGSKMNPAAELVLKQARERLRGVDARRLFPRRGGWQNYAGVLLFLVWFGLLWFDVDRSISDRESEAPQTLAHQLREFSRELQERAKSEGLRETFKAGQELEKVARQNIDAKTADDEFKKELAGVAKDIAAAGKAGAANDSTVATESQQSLQDLKAELGAARDLLNFPDTVKGSRELPQRWMDRLASLPQLQRQLDKEREAGQGFGPNELKSFLDRLDNQATSELDRRALLEAEKFLEQMMQSGPGNKRESDRMAAGRGEQEAPGEGVKEKNRSNLPGKEPGKIDDGVNSMPEFRGGAQTQVKGLLGDGDSSSVEFKGKPTAGKSKLEEQNVVANYRRQAEQELNSERVPEALKTTIRNYFLSLGQEQK